MLHRKNKLLLLSSVSVSEKSEIKLPDRLMAGLQILVLTVLVRIQLGQRKKSPRHTPGVLLLMEFKLV